MIVYPTLQQECTMAQPTVEQRVRDKLGISLTPTYVPAPPDNGATPPSPPSPPIRRFSDDDRHKLPPKYVPGQHVQRARHPWKRLTFNLICLAIIYKLLIVPNMTPSYGGLFNPPTQRSSSVPSVVQWPPPHSARLDPTIVPCNP